MSLPTFSQAPPVAKGRILVMDQTTPAQSVIVFQYNPEKLTRSLQPPTMEQVGGDGQPAIALRYKGAPTETINVDITVNAADQLERRNAVAHDKGVLPQLAVLETLVYPKSAEVKAADELLDQGQIEVASGYDAPFTLFEWGRHRTLPVLVTSLSVTEDLFDVNLNPIKASVTLGLKALTYSDVISKHKGYKYFMAYQKSKEEMARLARV